MVLGTGVAQLIRLIGPWQRGEPAVESVNEPVRSCLYFSGDEKVEHQQPLCVQAGAEASEPGLPLWPTGDGAVHDPGHEDIVNATWANGESQKVRLCEEGAEVFGHGLLSGDVQAFPVDIEAHDGKASLR